MKMHAESFKSFENECCRLVKDMDVAYLIYPQVEL